MNLVQVSTNLPQTAFIERVFSFCEYASEKCRSQRVDFGHSECFILNISYSREIQKAVVIDIPTARDANKVSLGQLTIHITSELNFDYEYFASHKSPDFNWCVEGLTSGSDWKWFVNRIRTGSTFLNHYSFLNTLRIDFEKHLKIQKTCNEVNSQYVQDKDTGLYHDPESIGGFPSHW